MGKKPYFVVKLKDRQSYYYSDETIPCVLELRVEKPLKDPWIRITFKGRSSSYTNASMNHYESIFDVQQIIRRDDIVPHQTLEIEFTVEAKKGIDIPSFCTKEGIEGGKVEYMVEAILESSTFIGRKERAKCIADVPLIAKVNVAEASLRKIKESSITWPKTEEEIYQCKLHVFTSGTGWLRGKTIPVYINWKQPERYVNAKRLELVLFKQETIASSSDKPPNMSLKLVDKTIVKVAKDISLERDQANGAMVMNGNYEIDIPSNITPTIQGNGKTVQINYKLCITVFLPELGPNSQDREVSVNMDIVIGTVHESGVFDISNQVDHLSISSRPGSFRSIDHTAFVANPPPPPVREQEQNQPTGHNTSMSPSNGFDQFLDNDDSDFVQRSVITHSPTLYYTPYETPRYHQSTPPSRSQTNFSQNLTNSTSHPPQHPVINTGYPSQQPLNNTGHSPQQPVNRGTPPATPTHHGYPPNSHTSYSSSTNQVYQELRENRPEHTNSIKYQTKTPPNASPSPQPQQIRMYPPEILETALPMEFNPQEEEILRTNHKIEQNIYPPPEHDYDAYEMASPVCYISQFQNDYLFNLEESASDENTTLSSKNSCRNNNLN